MQITAYDWNVVQTGNILEQWIEVNIDKVVITIFHGSVVTRTVLGGLQISYRP